MFKAIGGEPGDHIVVLGLSHRNLELLRADQPVLVDLAELGLPGIRVVIFTGPTEEQMEATLQPLLAHAERIDPKGLELVRLRNRRGYTQADLAVLTGKSEAAISRFERGERRPAPETVVKLARALGVSATRLKALLPDVPVEPP
jgi:DNA-binding XRE family transcriptional regulator